MLNRLKCNLSVLVHYIIRISFCQAMFGKFDNLYSFLLKYNLKCRLFGCSLSEPRPKESLARSVRSRGDFKLNCSLAGWVEIVYNDYSRTVRESCPYKKHPNRSPRLQNEEAVHCRGDSRIARKRTVQPTVTTTNRGGNTRRRDRRPRRSANEHFNQPPRQSTEKAV